MIYVDTSALAAYYCPEPLSAAAERALRVESERAVSWLAEVELAAAVARKVRTREMDFADARRIASLFQSHLEQRAYIRLGVSDIHFAKACEWLLNFAVALHSLDALHLAVAALNGCEILTADSALAKACGKLGVGVRLIR